MDYLKAAKETITSSNALTGNAQKAYLLVRKDIMKETDKSSDMLLKYKDDILKFSNTLQKGIEDITLISSLLSMN